MKEFDFDIYPALNNGLQPDTRTVRDKPYLTLSHNLVPRPPYGSVTPEPVSMGITIGTTFRPYLSLSWPLPALGFADKVRLLFHSDMKIYAVDASWTATALSMYNAGTNASVSAFTGTGAWHLAAFSDLWFATNGNMFAWSIPTNSPGPVMVSSTMTPSTVARVGNRLVMGGFPKSHSWFFGSRWATVMADWRATQLPDSIIDPVMVPDSDWVIECTPGPGYDAPFQLIVSMLGMRGNAVFDAFQTRISDAIKGSAITMRQVPGIGNILQILPDGTVAGTLSVQTPKETIRVGAGGRNCACPAFFIDAQGNQYKFPFDSVKRYAYFFGPMDKSKIVISYDDLEHDYWLTDGATCYVQAPAGLGGPIDQRPTSLFRDPSLGLVGPTGPLPVRLYVHVTSQPLFMGETGQKTLTETETVMNNMGFRERMVEYRNGQDDNWKQSTWAAIGREGFCFNRVKFSDGRLHVRGQVPVATGVWSPASIEHIRLWREYSDKRGRRGTTGTPTET